MRDTPVFRQSNPPAAGATVGVYISPNGPSSDEVNMHVVGRSGQVREIITAERIRRESGNPLADPGDLVALFNSA